jgi:hypothetical protein
MVPRQKGGLRVNAKQNRKTLLQRRLKSLQSELDLLRGSDTVDKPKKLAALHRKIQLVKNEVKTMDRPNAAKPAPTAKKSTAKPKSTPSVRKDPVAGPAVVPPLVGNSIQTIASLRAMTKQALRYVQRADSMIDTLFSTASSLHESGVLQKLLQHRGKNLNTNDFSTILMSLLNSPIGGKLFERLGGSADGQK